MNRRTSILTVLWIAASLPAAADEADPVKQPPSQTHRHVRVVWLTDPCHEAVVIWDTPEAGGDHSLTLRKKDERDSETTFAAESGKYSYAEGESASYWHQTALSSLEPATTYEIRLPSHGHDSAWFHFDTAPDDGRPFSLAFGGDSRTGLETRKEINCLLATLTERSWQANDPAGRIYALAHGGDYVFFGTNAQQWQQWRKDHALTTTPSGRLLPIIPARGNHDRGRLFSEAFGFDREDGNYYGLSFGKLLRFVTLNTEVSIAGDQAKWLDDELSRARPAHRWLVVQYHRPAYPAVKSPSGALVHWVPLFEQFDVDLVCEADGHNIKRTLPIRNGTYDPDGVVYIGEGGLGVPQRSPKASRWFLQAPGFGDRGHHIHVLRFTPDQMTVDCQLLDGETRDTYTRNPRK